MNDKWIDSDLVHRRNREYICEDESTSRIEIRGVEVMTETKE
jgi:hypothetical protein